MSDVYMRLAAKLDELPQGFPTTQSGVELKILEKLYTREEAEIALRMRLIPETVEAIAAGVHQGLPDGSFLSLSISNQYEHSVTSAVVLYSHRHAHRDRQAEPERPGGNLYARHRSAVGVAAEVATRLDERVEKIFRKKAVVGQNDVEGHASVPFAQNEPVPIRPGWAGGVEPQDSTIV